MAAAVRTGPRDSPLDEVRERFRAVEEAEPGHDRTRYVEALKAFLATAERHAEAIAPEGRDVAPLLDEAAMAFYRASDPELAERAVDLGLKLSPGTSTLLHHKALVLLALNRDLPEVVRLLDEAIAVSPNDRGLWATRGDALRLLGRPAEAADAYLRAQELDPSSSEFVDRALKLVPHEPRALRAKVEIAKARGGDLQGLAAAEELLGLNPNDEALRFSRAELLASLGRRDEALEAVHALGGTGAAPPRVLEIRLLFDLGRIELALPLAQGIVAADPPPAAQTLEEIAQASTAAQPELAYAARERLAALDRRNVQNLLDLKRLATSLGKSEGVLAACRAVLEADPENLEAMRGIAETEASNDRLVESLEVYRRLAKAHPRAVGELRKALAIARTLKRAAEVAEFAEAVLVAEPADAEARAELARALVETGDVAGALEEYDQLLKAHPGDVRVLLAKRELLTATGDRAALLPVLDDLFRLDPTRTDVAVERGHLYLGAAYDLPEGSPERHEAARSALVSYERSSAHPDAANLSLLGIARASRLIDDPERALSAYVEFLGKDGNRDRWDVHKERAHALREAGHLAEAVEEYERALSGGLDDPDLLWGAADAYARLGQTASALRLLDVLLRREPNEPVFLRRKGQILLAAGRRDEAQRVLQEALRGAEHDPQAYLEVAEALRAQGAYADAVAFYQRALAIDPKHRHGRLALAETLLLAGRYSEVLGIVDPLLKEDPNDLAAWKARADAWRALGRSAEVLYSLEAILLLDPESPPALLEMYRLRRERGETKEAYEALERLLRVGEAEGKEATLHLELGDLASALGQPEAANAAYEKAAAIDPAMRVEIAMRRARLRLAAGRPDLALEVLDQSLAGATPPVTPSVAVLLLRAELLTALERPAEARAAFEEVRRREPRSPTAAVGIARSMLAEGRPGEAATFLKEALAQLPPEDGTYLVLAEAEGGLGHLDRARDALAKGLEALPRSVPLWSRLGEVGIARQAWPEAANAFAHALALSPTSLELLLRAGFVAERLGHPNEALSFYERATEADPTNTPAWTSGGLALLALGRPQEATACFDRALSLDSDFGPAKDGKKLAGQKTRDAEVQRYGRDALLLEAKLNRPVTKNDLFVTLHVPYEFLTPVLREIGQAPKVDLGRLEPEEARELDAASYSLISAALEHRPPGIEHRGFTLADVAVLSPSASSLVQIQRQFGYLRAVLESDVKPEQISLTPEVEELARKALALPPEGRTLFQLVRTLRVGVYKARLIKAVEEAGAATGTRPPALDLGAYSPEFRPTPATEGTAGDRFFAPETRPAPVDAAAAPSPAGPTAGPTGPAAPAVRATPVGAPAPKGPAAAAVPMTAKAGDRCVGCGGLAAGVHGCGATLCATCVSQYPKCPKCRERFAPASVRPIPGTSRTTHPSERAASTPGTLGALKGVFRRPSKGAPPEPPSAPSTVPRSSGGNRRGSVHRPDRPVPARERSAGPASPPPQPAAKKSPASESAKETGKSVPAPSSPPPRAPAKAPEPKVAEPAPAAPPVAAEPAPASSTKAKPAKTDDEPRL